jgi:hypothetical protein
MSESRDAMIERAKGFIHDYEVQVANVDWSNRPLAETSEADRLVIFALAEIAQAERKAVADAFEEVKRQLRIAGFPSDGPYAIMAMDSYLAELGIGEDNTDA